MHTQFSDTILSTNGRTNIITCILLLALVFLKTAETAEEISDELKQAFCEIFPNTENCVPDSSPSAGSPVKNNEQRCKCVPQHLCEDDQVIVTNKKRIIDIRISQCSDYLETCCYNQTETQADHDYNELNAGCGVWNPYGVGFTITGNDNNEAQFGEFPWMVSIREEDDYTLSRNSVCGGSLVHPKVVLTAAHCVYGKNPKSLVVRAGEWDTMTTNEPIPHQNIKVDKIVMHEKYDDIMAYNDIALILVSKPFKLTENIRTICLPNTGFENGLERCFASGWGKDSKSVIRSNQAILKKIELPIVPRSACLDELRKTRLGESFELHESFICAGGEDGKDTCDGDGGSPLMCPIPEYPDKFHQSGIVSWGIGCGQNNIPGVYTNVAKFRNWIDKQMNKHNLDKQHYNPSA
ncbi:phenoloxidase-activating factor 2-like isoform X2 [Adelges cooleyi]|nr:phenoloxidase-activating factor 2-like isoform X2 [Adelges cooleyi]XP_050420469.1 phenoloxidase-activating factor 2-like isoform X2 [Adelges cooleyi]